MVASSERFVIFDGNAILHRAWHALPPLTSPQGQLVNAVYGFTNMFLKVLKELKPDYLAVTFDRREPTFRHKAFAEYKAQRIKQPQEFYDQLPLVKEVLQGFNVTVFDQPGYEADDIIGTLATLVGKQQPAVEVIIVTGDMDALQLVTAKVKVYVPRKGLSDPVIYDPVAVQERYNLTPEQLIDYKALRGDPSDNIPGVKGIGEKTAQELIKNFGSLDNIYQSLATASETKGLTLRQRELLQQGQTNAYLSKDLSTIVCDVPLKFKLVDCFLKSFNSDLLVSLLQTLGFKSLLARLPELAAVLGVELASVTGNDLPTTAVPQGARYEIITDESGLQKLVGKLKKQKFFAFDTETDSLNVWQVKLLAISFSWSGGQAYTVVVSDSLQAGTAWLALKNIMADEAILKSGHNLKFDIEVLSTVGWQVVGVSFDTLIAAHLLQKGDRVLDLKSLVFQEFGHKMQAIEELIGPKGKEQKSLLAVAVDKMGNYAAADADFTWRLTELLNQRLVEEGLIKLFQEVETPLVKVLVNMEKAGVKIDGDYLQSLAKVLNKELKKKEVKICHLAGRTFNVNSPKQLKEVLFDELKISSQGLKKTKTGISTAATELTKMMSWHPIIKEILEQRELSKLLSTYVEALPKLINPLTQRVHTSFNQTVTATGRLSSSDPNLQNIPIKGDWAAKVRQAFVAEAGYVLLSADYSQIELRIAAHLAKDKKMIEVFAKGQDFHTSTAAYVYGVKLADVTSEQRRGAKEVNFGILYGMGAWGLSVRTGLDRSTANDFIKRYFKAFPALANWIEETKQTAKSQGYVRTLLGRRRYLPEINSTVGQMRAQAERMAINLPVQGTAADLMKMAMVKIDQKLKHISPTSRMILQVHDELVFEVPVSEVLVVGAFVKKTMEQAWQLEVPIVAEVKSGLNWSTMEKIDI
ncbi:DNA polymerase I [Patescibacteria group bacterium]|nr:DNA polymerase I [Patescibacteria group bacterium]